MTVAHLTEHIPNIEKRIGYTFRDKSLLVQAFTRTSFCNEDKTPHPLPRQSNEVLEFFGDSVLSVAIVSLLMRDLSKRYEFGIYTELTEGDLSSIKSHLSDKKHLSEGMRALGLQIFLCMGEGDIKLGVQNEPSVMEDLFESIIGAVYVDCDMDLATVMSVVSHMLNARSYLEPTKEKPLQSYKNALQEFCADKKRRLGAPQYEAVREEGPEHCRVYTRACRIDGRTVGIGTGKNQKAAEAEAAKAALEALRKEEAEGVLPVGNTDKEDHIRRLNAFAAEVKAPAPFFRDLGAAKDSTASAPRFLCECRFRSYTVTAEARSKRDAKQAAAYAMLRQLKPLT